jgi:lipopolysaccharide exporter
LLFAGLENIGIIDFQKHMQFGAELRFRFLRRIITFAITVTAAVWLRSYWALVIGTLAGRAIGVVLSYWVHPMRPRISFEKFREIFHVSKWMMINRIGVYFQKNLHKILIGRWSPTGTMGAYTLADEISSMPTGELLAPVNRALFPSFAKVKDDPARLKEIFLLAQGVQTLIAVPAAAGLAVIAQEAVPILLGDNWDATIPFIQVLALVNIAQALTTSGRWVLIVIGRVRTSALFGWVQVALFAVLALTVFYESEAINIAWLRLLVGGTGLWLLLWLLVRGFPLLRAREVVANSIRPLLAAAIMALCVTYMATQLAVSIILALVLKVAVGAIVYTASIVALWRLAGRPPGAESYVLGKASSLVAAWRRNRTIR